MPFRKPRYPEAHANEAELPGWVRRWLNDIDSAERSVGWPEDLIQINREAHLDAWCETVHGRLWLLRCALRALGRDLLSALRRMVRRRA